MIFLDCGFYAGVALQRYIDKGLVDETWTVYAFEPVPIQEHLNRYPWVHHIKKAVWTKDGRVNYWLSRRENASHISGTSHDSENKKTSVACIDFPKFVSQLPDEFTVCSMDIEGSEYRVLEKMLEDGTIDKIDLLDIEFHHRLMAKKTKKDSQTLLDELVLRTAVKLKEFMS